MASMTKTIKAYAEPIADGVEYIYDFYTDDQPFASAKFEARPGILIVHLGVVRVKPSEIKFFKKSIYGIGTAIAWDFGYKDVVFFTKNAPMVKLFGDTMTQIGTVEDYTVYMQKVPEWQK